MKFKTHRFHSYCIAKHLTLPLVLAAVATGLPLCGMAQPPQATVADTGSAKVALSDLDLTTGAGIQAAHARLEAMSKRLCLKFVDSRTTAHFETYVDCYRDTLHAALRRLNYPSLAERGASSDRAGVMH